MIDPPDPRSRILAAARRLFAEAGDGRGVAIGRVAAEAGVSRASVYRYFPDRAALTRAVAEAIGSPELPAEGRERILEAALDVIAERGIHGTTLRQIADRAGLSLSGVTWHFKNKDELVAGLADHLRVLPTIAAEAAVAGTADLEEQLTHIADAVLGVFARRGGLLRVAICEATTYPEVARLASTHTIGRALPLLAGLFEEHARRGSVRPGPARIRAQAFISMIVMLGLIRPAFGDLLAADDQTCAREYIRILLHGIATRPPEGR